jgi:enoyl-CoA hydratase
MTALANKLAASPPQALQETKRAINLHVQAAIARVAPFAHSTESESFATDDLRKTIENFKTQQD